MYDCNLAFHFFLHISNRSAAYAALKQFEDALKDATACTDLDPYWAKGWYRKGLAQVGLERYRDAEESYRRGVGKINRLLLEPFERFFCARISWKAHLIYLITDYAPRDDDLQRALQEVKMML